MALQIIILFLLISIGMYQLYILTNIPKLLQALVDRKDRQQLGANRKFYQYQNFK